MSLLIFSKVFREVVIKETLYVLLECLNRYNSYQHYFVCMFILKLM